MVVVATLTDDLHVCRVFVCVCIGEDHIVILLVKSRMLSMCIYAVNCGWLAALANNNTNAAFRLFEQRIDKICETAQRFEIVCVCVGSGSLVLLMARRFSVSKVHTRDLI